MARSLVRRLVAATLALGALSPALALPACVQPGSQAGSTLRFAVSTTTQASATTSAPAVRVGQVRVLSRHVNLQEPIILGAADENVTLTFALRQREGATLILSPESLEPRNVTPFAYPAHAKLPLPTADPTRVNLANGGSVSCWTDDTSGRVLAQAFSAAGASLGAPVTVSPEGMDVFGAPRVIAADGRHVVAAFFVSTEEGFALVAASIEQLR